LKFKYVGGLVQNSSTSDTSLKTFFRGGEFITVGKLEQPIENQVMKVQVEGVGFGDRFCRDTLICLRPTLDLNDLENIESQHMSICHMPPTFPPRSRTQKFMKKLHAFLNIKQLIKKSGEQNKEKALKLSLENNFVTDLTSLVVVRPDDERTVASLVDPFSSSSETRFAGVVASSLQFDAYDYSYASISDDYDDSYEASLNIEELLNEKIIPNNGTNTSSPIFNCTGNLTLFSKTYLRGDEVTFVSEKEDLAEISFDNKAVSASVIGECCWIVFSENFFNGNSKVLSTEESYTGVTSLGQLFREISSVRRIKC